MKKEFLLRFDTYLDIGLGLSLITSWIVIYFTCSMYFDALETKLVLYFNLLAIIYLLISLFWNSWKRFSLEYMLGRGLLDVFEYTVLNALENPKSKEELLTNRMINSSPKGSLESLLNHYLQEGKIVENEGIFSLTDAGRRLLEEKRSERA